MKNVQNMQNVLNTHNMKNMKNTQNAKTVRIIREQAGVYRPPPFAAKPPFQLNKLEYIINTQNTQKNTQITHPPFSIFRQNKLIS
jgi:hypothetical protein